MKKYSLSVPLLIGIAGKLDKKISGLLEELNALVPATPIFLLQSVDDDSIKAEAFGDAVSDGTSKFKDAKVFTPASTVGASIDDQRAAYLLKNCTFVVVQEDCKAGGLGKAIDAYRNALPYWTPPTNDARTFGNADDAFSLPYPASVLDAERLQTLIRMLLESSTQERGYLVKQIGIWSQAKEVIFGNRSLRIIEEDLPYKKSPRERSAFLSLPGQLRNLEAFNAELACLQTAQGLMPETSILMSIIMEASDKLAQDNQNAWQNLVYTTTKRLAYIEENGAAQSTEDKTLESSKAKRNEIKEFRPPSLLSKDDLVSIDESARWKSLAVLGVVAATMLAVFTELATSFEDQAWQRYAGVIMLSIYVLVLAYAFYRYRNAKIYEHERKHQDYRLIAECLRVQQSWASCGIRHYVADALPPEQVSESTWVNNAIRSIRWRHTGADTWSWSAGIAAKERFVAVQLRYHDSTLVKRREKALELLDRRARRFLVFFLIGLAGLFLNSVWKAYFEHGIPELLHHFWIILTVMMVSLWAAHKKVADTFGLEGEALRGRAMRDALKQAHATLVLSLAALTHQSDAAASATQDDESHKTARLTLLGIGKAFVRDQAAWHALHRSRPIEVVTGT